MTVSVRTRFVFRTLQALGMLGVFGYGLQAAFPALCGNAVQSAFEGPVYTALIGLGAALCLWRAATVRSERAAWLVLGLGVLAWAAGEVVYSLFVEDLLEPPIFGVSEALWLAFYPCCYAAIVLLLRGRVRDFRPSLWLDGLVGALAAAAVGAALVYGPIARAAAETGVAVDLAFLLGDALLVGFLIFAVALTGWRPGRAWGMLVLALAIGAAVDAYFLYDAATGAAGASTLVATLWPASALACGFAAWKQPATSTLRIEGGRLLVMPAAFSLAALAVLGYGLAEPVAGLASALAIAALGAAIVRMCATFRENVHLLERSRHLALTDPLTGLPNRRQLMLDLEQAVANATPATPCGLMLFDLDGFKQYNDRFGHPVGDALLARLGHRLAEAVAGAGSAYRLGGDEFCVVAPEAVAPEALVDRAREALSDRGEAFGITSSSGLVLIPAEAADVATALRIADERLYAHKGEGRRAVVSEQTSSALLQVLKEIEPSMESHPQDVARLARSVGAEIGLSGRDRDDLIRVAELHDIGKVAVPSAILNKPGPLDETEWRFIHQHTAVGDRILSAAPALASMAAAVRGSHERWDGAGYPDGLARHEIPLAARIVAVCDAYAAMTANRPYRGALSHHQALEELRRCAGRQFDPVVVEAFCEAVGGAEAGRPRATRRQPARPFVATAHAQGRQAS